MNYKLLATDLDGTLLTSDKRISRRTQNRINQALDAGKIILFSSGRCMQEIEEFLPLFPKMRYVICESGAGIYDIQEKCFLYQKVIDPSYVESILDYALTRDIMIQVLADNHSMLSRKDYEHLEHFQLEYLQDHFSRNAVIVDSSYHFCKNNGWNASKICLYHPNKEERKITREALAYLPLSFADSEQTSLEISPPGIDKGMALAYLCTHLGIAIEESIAIGDGLNDETILKRAGFALAMENAAPEIKQICPVIMADNDHDGVAESIETYLLDL